MTTEGPNVTTAMRRRDHVARVAALAARQAGVVARRQIYAAGLSRAEVRAHIGAGRWRAYGRHCVAVHTGPLTEEGRHWAAVLEAGPRAYVDGDSALVLAGLEHYTPERIRMSVPRGARIRHRGSRANIRQTRRWDPEDIEPSGMPRSRPAVAAVRAALWAKSDRQATLLLTMTVQQGLVTVEELAAQAVRIRRDRRRRLVHEVILELGGGVGSLGELDVVRGCRKRGLPEPDKQVLRRSASGVYYLDFRWQAYGVTVEVDGIHHGWAQNIVADALRHNTIALDNDTVLRLPVLGLQLCPDDFFGQIETALRNAGWRGLPGVA